tara:strand:+ start:234 stop:617 length:384 start_codon:yes stop_codon:yes gene_type:complete
MKKILHQILEKTLFRVLDNYVEKNLIPILEHRLYDNIDFHQRQDAIRTSAEFVSKYLQGARPLTNRLELLRLAIERVSNPGLFLEFGVASGASINFIAANTDTTVHGFDSFQGLPEDWPSRGRQWRI